MAVNFYTTGVNQVTGTTGALSLKALMNAASSGKGDAAALLSNVNYVMLNPEGAIRFTVDGSTPTTAIGFQGASGGFYYIEGTDILNKLTIINAQKVNIAVGSIT